MFSVTALGELLVDFTDAGTSAAGQRLFERNAGGAPANVLVALARMGHQVAFVGKVGRDMHGEFLHDALASAGVDVRGLVTDPDHFTTLAFVALDDAGDRSFSFARKPGADTCLTPDELPLDVIADSRVFHVGSLSLTDEPARSATLAALDAAQAAGCVLSYDPNYREPLWPGEATARARMRSVLARMDLVKVSDAECALLTDEADPRGAAEKIVSGGASVCVVTLGARGAYVRTRDGGATVPAFATQVTDTTGAGDAFWGGFLSAFCESGKTPGEVTLADARAFARVGNAVAALCVRGRGGIPSMPAREDVEALLG